MCAVADGRKLKSKLPSIKNMTEEEEKQCLLSLLRTLIPQRDKCLSASEIILKYRSDIDMVCKIDKDTKEHFGMVNTWWVFGEVAKELSYPIFMAEADQVGYKRTSRGLQTKPNDLFRFDNDGKVIVDDGIYETILDYIRQITW